MRVRARVCGSPPSAGDSRPPAPVEGLETPPGRRGAPGTRLPCPQEVPPARHRGREQRAAVAGGCWAQGTCGEGGQCLRQTSQLHFTVPVSTRTCTRCSVHWVRFGNVNRPVSSPPNHDLACSRQAGRSPPLAPGHAAGLAPWGRHPDTPLFLLQVLPLLELHANESQCGVF